MSRRCAPLLVGMADFRRSSTLRDSAIADSPLIENVIARRSMILFMDQHRIVLADQLFAAETEQLLHAVIDEGEAAFMIKRVNDVGRAIDQITVKLFRAFESPGDAAGFRPSSRRCFKALSTVLSSSSAL